jgi:hypothetical protein
MPLQVLPLLSPLPLALPLQMVQKTHPHCSQDLWLALLAARMTFINVAGLDSLSAFTQLNGTLT